MRVILTGGGTAGHVTPLLAVASELKKRDSQTQIRYIGNVGDRFAAIAHDSSDIDSSWCIIAGKLRRFHGASKLSYFKEPLLILRNIRDIFYAAIGYIQSLWLLLWWRPDVLFVKGGFVALPVGLAAATLRIPMVTHDSDAVAGLTNRILSKYAKFNAVAMPASNYSYAKTKLRHTGLPLRADITIVTAAIKKQARAAFGISDDAFVVVIVGGSLGAVRLNNAAISQAYNLLATNKKLRLVHLTGQRQFKEIDAFYSALPADESNRVLRWSFRDDFLQLTAAADIVVTRAGSSMFEFAVQKLPIIVVPNPILTGGHQTVNANALVALGAAELVTELDLAKTNNVVLSDTITALMNDSTKRQLLATALNQGLAVDNAAGKIVDVLLEAIKS